MARIATAGQRRHLVNIDNPSRSADGDGGYTETFAAASPATSWCRIEPATPSNIERLVGSTVEGKVTHLVTLPYHSGVTLRSRLTHESRYLFVRGIQNIDELDRQMMLACEEVTA